MPPTGPARKERPAVVSYTAIDTAPFGSPAISRAIRRVVRTRRLVMSAATTARERIHHRRAERGRPGPEILITSLETRSGPAALHGTPVVQL